MYAFVFPALFRPTLLRFTALIGLASLIAAPRALAQLTSAALADLVLVEDQVSGSLLPFPARGAAGVVEGLSVTYEQLAMLGLVLRDVRFEVSETDSDGLYAVNLAAYSLGEATAQSLAQLGYGESLPTFSGVWDAAAQTYASYVVEADLALAYGETRQQGTLRLTAATGVEGGLTLTLTGFDYARPDNDLRIAGLEARLVGAQGQRLDPYALTNGLASLGAGTSFDNPMALLALLTAYSQEIFGTDLDLHLTLNDAQGRMDGGADGEISGQVDQAVLTLAKRGEGPNGAQSLTLDQTYQNAALNTEEGGLAFETLASRQSLSFNDLMGLIPQMLPLTFQASAVETPGDAAPLARTLGQIITTFDPAITISAEVTGLQSLSPNETSPMPAEIEGKAARLRYDLVIDLKEEIALRAAVSDASYTTRNELQGSDFHLQSGGIALGLTLWEGFVGDLAAAISEGLIAYDQAVDTAAQGEPANLAAPAQTLARLLGGLFATGDIQGLRNGEAVGPFQEAFISDRFTWDFSTKQDQGAAKLDLDVMSQGVFSLFELDDNWESVNEDRQYALLSAEEIAAARANAGDSPDTFLAQGFHLDTDVRFGALAPFIAALENAQRQAEALRTKDEDQLRAVAQALSFAGLQLFDEARLAFNSEGITSDTITLGKADFEVLLGELMGYRAAVSDFAFDVADPAQGGDTRLDFASLDAVTPLPEGFGAAVAAAYADQILAMALETRLTWGDVLAVYAHDMASQTADLNIQGLDIVLVPDELSLALGDATLLLPSALRAKPLSLEQALRLNWSDLRASAARAPVQTALDALLPHEGLVALTARASLSDGALKRLAPLPYFEPPQDSAALPRNLATALAEMDLAIDVTSLNLLTRIAQLEGQGQARPDLAPNLEGGAPLPNVTALLTLHGLPALQATVRDLQAPPLETLGPVAWIAPAAAALTPALDWFEAYADASDVADDADTLSFDVRIPSPQNATVNGKPLTF